MRKILFICKRNEVYSFHTYCRKSSGLFNSTKFIADYFNSHSDIIAKLVEVTDNNDIDREVFNFNPDIVVIEALWVVPDKFTILKKLHPNVKWFVHMHSAIPFLAGEGVAIEWLYKYVHTQEIGIIVNAKSAFEAFKEFMPKDRLFYLPNIYPGQMQSAIRHECKRGWIDIGCFGAIRPMKNQLIQAFAALKFAEDKDVGLRFHINGSRVEMGGDPILENLISLFAVETQAKLIMHPWCEPEEFVKLLHDEIDLGMQVSMTETFSVITADYVAAGLTIVVSDEVYWASDLCKAKIDSLEDIVEVMNRVWNNRFLTRLNQFYLNRASTKAQKSWLEFVNEC